MQNQKVSIWHRALLQCILLAVERDTPCMSILLNGCGNGYTLHVHTVGCGKGYILQVHSAAWLWKWIRPACPHFWLWKGLSKRKHKRFDIGAYYRNKTKTFWFGPLSIGTKPKCFDLVRLVSERKQNVSICFKIVYNQIGTFWRFFKFKNVYICSKLLQYQNWT